MEPARVRTNVAPNKLRPAAHSADMLKYAAIAASPARKIMADDPTRSRKSHDALRSRRARATTQSTAAAATRKKRAVNNHQRRRRNDPGGPSVTRPSNQATAARTSPPINSHQG